MIKAAVFDLDGLLIDTEPIWEWAEKRAFGEVGMELTSEMKAQTTGLRLDETIRYWYERHPWTNPDFASLRERITGLVAEGIENRAAPMEGVAHILSLCRELGLDLAVASSSSPRLISAILKKLDLGEEPDGQGPGDQRSGGLFKAICSGEAEAFGKPHPAVYLRTAEKLGVKPEECVAFEDSVNGVKSAKAAGMFCIAVPDSRNWDNPGYAEADLRVRSLLEISRKELAAFHDH